MTTKPTVPTEDAEGYPHDRCDECGMLSLNTSTEACANPECPHNLRIMALYEQYRAAIESAERMLGTLEARP